MRDYKEVRPTELEELGREQRAATFRATQIILLPFLFIEAVLGLRVVFKLIGVNTANPFATLLYSVTAFLVAPFAGLFGSPALGNMVLEISTIIAMIVYLLIAWGLERIVYVLFYRPRGPVSVRQTIVSDQAPQLVPVESTQTTVTKHTSV